MKFQRLHKNYNTGLKKEVEIMCAAKPFLTKKTIVNICRDHFGLLVDSDEMIRELTSFDDRNYQVKGKKITTSGKGREWKVKKQLFKSFTCLMKKSCSEKKQGSFLSGLLEKYWLYITCEHNSYFIVFIQQLRRKRFSSWILRSPCINFTERYLYRRGLCHILIWS